MNSLARILQVDYSVIKRLSDAGVLRSNAARDYDIYNYFLLEKEKYGVMQSITNAADKFFISEDCAKKIIYSIKKVDNLG
ncbi:hypothetical protein FACS189434_09390 [Bacteroidia bacterium]|nr:hypothetical protein FACS189434_09390 [Bacteroidia bacterium]